MKILLFNLSLFNNSNTNSMKYNNSTNNDNNSANSTNNSANNNDNILKDNNGFISIFDILIAMIIIVLSLMLFTTINNIDIPLTIEERSVSYNSEDIMESLSAKPYENNKPVLEIAMDTLKSNNNSDESIKSVGIMIGRFLNETTSENYLLAEMNQINSTVLASRGDIEIAENISTVNRHFGDYNFLLYLW
ncbi:hypothetical protein [Methanobrevibacter filiformis]|uniref:Uncharacterized protein n=1 Tax=Methanobrevibacter filiformis TaxID=55758 RepID=A0A165ZP68_9EURY|nr:hypothetical protein [Methanobrevibacter filiformis]KZX10978.1 hypothetical protein MBFIL_15910 [Methanobrevibacter filiformis]